METWTFLIFFLALNGIQIAVAASPAAIAESEVLAASEAAAAAAIGSLCYFPSGQPALGNVPCNNGTAFSSCCSTVSNCLANGLCLVNSDEDTVEFGRGGCTDPSWASEYCFPRCITTPWGVPSANGAAVFECNTVGYNGAAEYCCETGPNQKTSCCQTSSLLFNLGAGLPTATQILASMNVSSTQSQNATSSGASPTSITPDVPTSVTRTTLQHAPSAAAATSGQQSGNQRVHSPTSTSDASAQATLNPSTTQATAGLQTSSSVSPSTTSAGTNSSETMVIVIAVTVPVFLLLTALLIFLVWNNRRNNREIRSLKDGQRYGSSSSSICHVPSPTEYNSPMDVDNTSPEYPKSAWRSEYYKPNLQTNWSARACDNHATYELPYRPDPQELDSANETRRASEQNQI